MYCSTCGNQVKKELNYCNYCGGKIEKSDSGNSLSAFQSISTAVGAVGLGGMVAIIVFALKLLNKNVDISAVVVIIGMFLATILAIIYMTIRLMPQYLEKSTSNGHQLPNFVQPRSLTSANTAQLEESKQSPASVTENTTRTLADSFIERKN